VANCTWLGLSHRRTR